MRNFDINPNIEVLFVCMLFIQGSKEEGQSTVKLAVTCSQDTSFDTSALPLKIFKKITA